MLTEDEQVSIGFYCESLGNDKQFNNLVELLVKELSLNILDANTIEEREKIHYTYQGLKTLLEMMQQFVIVKDQVAARIEQENNK